MAKPKLTPLGCVVALLIALVVGPIARGLTMHILWGWFVVPTFHVAVPPVATLLGLNCLVSLFVPLPTNTKTDEEISPLTTAIVTALVVPAFFLGFGWVYHQF